MKPHELGAVQASKLIAAKKLSSEELIRSCLERITDREHEIRAWLHLDPDAVLKRAREIDNSGCLGPLVGIPAGFKDIIATRDMPTTYNSPLYRNHQVGRDAACVSVVRHSGGVVMGKTDTVEFATSQRRALSRNPRNTAHTPGGSSSGSAAAVADFHVPIAFGTQTGGSIIRPAAFTGIYAFKPTHGLVSIEGVKPVAPSLDTIGWYARCVEDLTMVAEVFRMPRKAETASLGIRNLRIGLCRTPMWQHTQVGQRQLLEETADRLAAAGAEIVEFDLPPAFSDLTEAAYRIVDWEIRSCFLSEHLEFASALDASIAVKVQGSVTSTSDIVADYDHASFCRAEFGRIVDRQRLSCVITPAACGEAPAGLADTGSSVLNTMWTLLHVPCVALPVGTGTGGLPLAVQLVAPRFRDAELLELADLLASVTCHVSGRCEAVQ